MPAKVIEEAVNHAIPAQRAIMRGWGRSRVGLKVVVEHISQIVVKFCPDPWHILCGVAKVILELIE